MKARFGKVKRLLVIHYLIYNHHGAACALRVSYLLLILSGSCGCKNMRFFMNTDLVGRDRCKMGDAKTVKANRVGRCRMYLSFIDRMGVTVFLGTFKTKQNNTQPFKRCRSLVSLTSTTHKHNNEVACLLAA